MNQHRKAGPGQVRDLATFLVQTIAALLLAAMIVALLALMLWEHPLSHLGAYTLLGGGS